MSYKFRIGDEVAFVSFFSTKQIWFGFITDKKKEDNLNKYKVMFTKVIDHEYDICQSAWYEEYFLAPKIINGGDDSRPIYKFAQFKNRIEDRHLKDKI